MDNSKNRQNDLLGVNKMGKNIKKSPLRQPNFANSANGQGQQQQPQPQPQPQPHVYNISKNDFRNIVQQLTGSPLQETPPRPPPNQPKTQSMRLQKIRPPPLMPINRPHIPPPVPAPAMAPPPVPYNNSFVRPPGQFALPSATMMPPMPHGDSAWATTAESPITAYMRYLENSIMAPSPMVNPSQPPLPRPQGPGPMQHQPPNSGLLPNPNMPALHSPRFNGPLPPVPNLHSPRMNGPALLPSPTSQFLLPSPTANPNFLYSQSPYPLLSPGIQFPPLTPNFAFSPMGQSGILGPGPLPPPSPGLMFPPSPALFPSPRWRDQ